MKTFEAIQDLHAAENTAELREALQVLHTVLAPDSGISAKDLSLLLASILGRM